MDINHVGDHECIHCGDCVGVCPTKAISWKGGKIILPENEIEAIEADETLDEQERREALAAVEAKRERRIKLLKTVTASVMAVVLAGALIYFNFLHKEPEVDVLTVGDSCYAEDLELVGGGGTVNVDFYQGKIVVINFWGTWCGPCKAELPHFDELAREYAEDVVVIAVHTESTREEAPAYIQENYPDSDIVWVYDKPLDQSQPDLGDFYYTTLGGSSSYPMTVILDGDGTIQFVNVGRITYEDLVLVVEMLKSE
jgi:thiol-disulfide isomerase/thioredoxin